MYIYHIQNSSIKDLINVKSINFFFYDGCCVWEGVGG